MESPPTKPFPVAARSWWILALLFAAGLLNYVDRQTLSILKATLKDTLGITDTDYSHLVTAFMVPYIIFYIVSGRIVDRWGTRKAMTGFIGVWSLANLACGMANGMLQLAGARAVLGAAEPGFFPGMLRAVMAWFPRERRAFALSLMTPCATVAAIIAPPLIAWLTTHWDWHGAFLIPGLLGVAVAVAWWWSDREAPGYDRETATSPAAPAEPMRALLQDRRVWVLIAVRALTDPVFYFHLFWLPGYLQEKLGMSLQQLGAVAWIPSLVAALCIVGMGRWSDTQVARGGNPATTRLKLFALSACVAPIGALTTFAPNIWVAFAIITAVTIVAQTWFFSYGIIVSELFPRSAASVTGLIGACGAGGGLLMNVISGPIIDHIGYTGVFVTLGLLHPLGAVLLHTTLARSPHPALSSGGPR